MARLRTHPSQPSSGISVGARPRTERRTVRRALLREVIPGRQKDHTGGLGRTDDGTAPKSSDDYLAVAAIARSPNAQNFAEAYLLA